MAGADAVIHIGAIYKVGIPKSKHAGDVRRQRARHRARARRGRRRRRARRIVYVSTGDVFGDTRGQVGERELRPRPAAEFPSYYDETKYLAHQIADDRIARGAPIVIVQPGGVYGPDDHSELGNMIDQARTGKLKLRMFPESGFNFVYVEDVAAGIAAGARQGPRSASLRPRRRAAHARRADRQGGAVAGREPPALHDARLRDEARLPDSDRWWAS